MPGSLHGGASSSATWFWKNSRSTWLSPLGSSRSKPAYTIRCPFAGSIVAHAYPFEKSSFAGTLPVSQCQHVVTLIVGQETGSSFLFDVPAPENVVQSVELDCDSWSFSKAAASPPYRFATFPFPSKMQPQSGGGLGLTHRMSAPCAGPSSNKPVTLVGAGPGDMRATATIDVNSSVPRARVLRVGFTTPLIRFPSPLTFIDCPSSSPEQKSTAHPQQAEIAGADLGYHILALWNEF